MKRDARSNWSEPLAKEPSADILNVLRHQNSDPLLSGGLLACPATDVDLLPVVDLTVSSRVEGFSHAPS
jgi:hypothetical protein